MPTPRNLFQLFTTNHPSMARRCQVLPICLWSSKCLSGGRFGSKDEERLRMLRFHCSVFIVVLICIFFLLLTGYLGSLLVRCCLPFSHGNRSSACLFHLVGYVPNQAIQNLKGSCVMLNSLYQYVLTIKRVSSLSMKSSGRSKVHPLSLLHAPPFIKSKLKHKSTLL